MSTRDVEPPTHDPFAAVRALLGAVLVIGGALVLTWLLVLAHGFLVGTWSPGIEQRLEQSAARVGTDLGVEAGSAALVAVPLVTLLGLSVMASIAGTMITAGVRLLQPDWSQILSRLEQSLMAVRRKQD